MVEFKLTGNWSIVNNRLKALPLEVESSATWGQRKAAEMIVRLAKAHINNQDLGWRPRAATTNSGDSRILVDSEDYFKTIKAWKQGPVYYAGVPRTKYNWRGVPIHEYAILHEFGYNGVPARPLWRPVYKEVGGKRGIANIVKKAIQNKIAKLKNSGFEIR